MLYKSHLADGKLVLFKCMLHNMVHDQVTWYELCGARCTGAFSKTGGSSSYGLVAGPQQRFSQAD